MFKKVEEQANQVKTTLDFAFCHHVISFISMTIHFNCNGYHLE